MSRPILAAAALALALACATSPTGRRQLKMMPDADMAQMGATAYDEMKSEMRPSDDAKATAYVRCVTRAVTTEVDDPRFASTRWEVTLFDEPSPNAFALPGGKIGVHTGLLLVAVNQDQLATVLGHEVAHVLADHGNERVSQQVVAQSGLQAVSILAGPQSASKDALMGALGLGAQVGVLLPYGRAQESEADILGLDLMAKAGFAPQESIALWKNMGKAGGAGPPEFLSTHPSHGTRIADLEQRMPGAILLSNGARSRGKRPRCG